MKTISILGCGWLGLEVARYFVHKNVIVKGSTTSPEKQVLLEKIGIQPYAINLNETIIEKDPIPFFSDFLESDVVVINIPPSKNREFYVIQIKFVLAHLLQNAKAAKKVIFISSTSIYPDLNRDVYEEDVQTREDAIRKDLFDAEQVLLSSLLEVVVLRAGGLMGGNRVAGRYFADKKDLNTGQIPVNFIHRKDLIQIIDKIITKNVWNTVFNAVCPEHPLRKEVYLKNAVDYNFAAPTFINPIQQPDFKRINSTKLCSTLAYVFDYPNPLYFPVE